MKFKVFVALAAAAAASALTWKALRDSRKEEEDVTLELTHRGEEEPADEAAVSPQESEGDAVSAEDVPAAKAEEPADEAPAGEAPAEAEDPAAAAPRPDPAEIASAADFSGDWEDIGCKS